MSKIIFKLAENENGESIFLSSNEVYDFIDDCRKEGITISELYGKIAEALNDEGFFKKKMSKKELKEVTSNPLLTMNTDKLLEKAVENAANKVVEKEIMAQI